MTTKFYRPTADTVKQPQPCRFCKEANGCSIFGLANRQCKRIVPKQTKRHTLSNAFMIARAENDWDGGSAYEQE